MSIDSALPSVKHLLVVVLFSLDAPLVLQLSELSGSLFIHNLLKFPAHCSVAFSNLTEYVRIVHLLCKTSFNHLLFISSVLSFNFSFHILTLILLLPFFILFFLLFKFNVLLPVLVDIFHQVYACLVFAIPLFFTLFPLFSIFFFDKFVNHLLIGIFVSLNLGSIFLKFNSFSTMRHFFFVLNLFDCALSFKCSLQQLQVTLSLCHLCLRFKCFLLFIVFKKAKITFSV